MSGVPSRSRWRFLFTPKWLGWHAFDGRRGRWACWRSATGSSTAPRPGNALSWAYTFEWPIFAVFGVVFWAKTIRDEFQPARPGRGPETSRCPAGAGRGAGPWPAGDSGRRPETRTTRNSPPTTPTWPG